MRSFYQGHVREPVFVAMTRAGLWSLDDQDRGVSLASAAGSTAAILGTYLVGAALVSPATGLIAAALMAGETEVVTWAVDGWRDDTFTATLLFATWSLLRLRQSPRRRYGAGGRRLLRSRLSDAHHGSVVHRSGPALAAARTIAVPVP